MLVRKKFAVLFEKLPHNWKAILHKRYESWWADVKMEPPDPIFGLADAWKADKDPKKVNLGVGAYRDDAGKPYVLPSVRKAEEKIFNRKMNHEYAPIIGLPEFCKASAELAFGEDSCVLKDNLNATVQSISGSGAIRLAAGFLALFHSGCKTVYVSKPTWINHYRILNHAGLQIKEYRYYNPESNELDFCGMKEDIANMPDKSIILFQAGCHNPTGIDPCEEEWEEISQICKDKHLMVFFDMAYQGFASGDLNKDAFAPRQFVNDGHQIILAQSFSKNMGLYGQRAGACTVMTSSKDEQARVISQLKILIRGLYSNPPVQGVRIATEVLTDSTLKCQWVNEVKGMADRIIGARKALVENLKKAGSCKNWDHIAQHVGMFCSTGLSPDQVKKITKEHHVYLPADGRISMAGVGSKNVEHVACALHAVTK